MSNLKQFRRRAVACCVAMVFGPVVATAQPADKAVDKTKTEKAVQKTADKATDKADKPAQKTAADRFGTRPILTDAEWQKLDKAVDRGLEFIAKQQSVDGSFPTDATGQPGVTALCAIAFLSRGHIPNE